MSYQVSFCFWLLTYEQNIAQQLNKYVFEICERKKNMNSTCDRKYDVIPVLIETAKSAIKEKVIRVIVATFRVRLLPPLLFFFLGIFDGS